VSNCKGPITTKTRKKKPANRPEYPSTNISSPVRDPLGQGLSKRSIQQYGYSGEYDPRVSNSAWLGRAIKNHRPDEFTAGDNEDNDNDDDGFDPPRIGKPRAPAPKKRMMLGPPITVDQRVKELNGMQKEVLESSLAEAKRLVQKIKMERNLRNPPFTDTVLREIILNLPGSVEEMQNTPGASSDKVERYGKRFLKIINNVRENYGSEIFTWRSNEYDVEDQGSDEEVEDEEEDGAVLDPNHQEVVIISDEEEPAQDVYEESVYSMSQEGDEDDDLHTSHHFAPPPLDPAVEAYNRRGSQMQEERMASNTSRARSASNVPARANSKGRAPYKKRTFQRKSSGSHAGKYPGINKRSTAKRGAARTSSGSHTAPPKRPLGGGGRGSGGGYAWKGVMAMPT
jgi:bloom syndrome protein